MRQRSDQDGPGFVACSAKRRRWQQPFSPARVERTRRAGALPVGIYLCHTKSKLQTEVTDPDSPAAENIGRHRFRRHVPATVDGDTEKHKL